MFTNIYIYSCIQQTGPRDVQIYTTLCEESRGGKKIKALSMYSIQVSVRYGVASVSSIDKIISFAKEPHKTDNILQKKHKI